MHRGVWLGAALLAAAMSFQAVAQQMPAIERRLESAKSRIYEGIRNGNLTRSDSERLNGEVDRIERLMQATRRDGVATRSERQDIRDRLAKVERDIDRLAGYRRRN